MRSINNGCLRPNAGHIWTFRCSGSREKTSHIPRLHLTLRFPEFTRSLTRRDSNRVARNARGQVQRTGFRARSDLRHSTHMVCTWVHLWTEKHVDLAEKVLFDSRESRRPRRAGGSVKIEKKYVRDSHRRKWNRLEDQFLVICFLAGVQDSSSAAAAALLFSLESCTSLVHA